MTAVIINGKQIAAQFRQELREKVKQLPSAPVLAVIQVGNNPASTLYVRNKQKAASEAGISSCLYSFPEDCTQKEILRQIAALNRDAAVNGILVQLPLPNHLNEAEILESINPLKDVDGFHPYNIGLLQNGSPNAVIAATPKGIMRLISTTAVPLKGKQALVIGRSRIVGKPVAMLLLQQDCTVTVAHSKTANLPELVKQSDIVVAACGCPEMVKGEWIKDGAVIIDVGINHKEGCLCGDVDFNEAIKHASFITPVPGGVGPMTIAMLLDNTYLAYLKQNNQ